MSLKQSATRLIKRYGFKGAATLNYQTGASFDRANNKKIQGTPVSISLLAFVSGYPTDKINGENILASDRMLLVAIDSDFDGTVPKDAKIVIDGSEYDVASNIVHRVKNVITYVEIQARG